MKEILKADAIRAGLTRYFTGKPCLRGHVAQRMVSNKRCVQCAAELGNAWKRAHSEQMAAQRRSWIARNPERHSAIKSAWNAANPEGQKARSRKWFLANREKAHAATKTWRESNLDKARARSIKWARENKARAYALTAKYHADKLQRLPAWADVSAIDLIYAEARKQREAGMDVHVDHVLPLRGRLVSGLHIPENLQIIPALFNRQKSNRLHFS